MGSGNVESIIQNYTGPKYEYWTRPTEDFTEWERPTVKALLTDKDARILNLGCGSGRETFAFFKQGYRNVRGADCTPALLEVARKRAVEKGWDLEFVQAASNNLPFEDGQFDAVTMFGNIYGHITPRQARIDSLREIARVLKPSGVVIFDANSILDSYLRCLAIRVFQAVRLFHNPCRMEPGDKLMHDANRTPNVSAADRPRSHWFTQQELVIEAQEAGLKVVCLSTHKGACADPGVSSPKVRGQGWLVCVLQKPAGNHG